MKRRRLLAHLLLLLPLLLTGCSRGGTPSYSYYQMLEEETWATDQELFFTFPVEKGACYRIEGGLRIASDCLLSELPLGVVLETPEQEYREYRFDLPIPHPMLSTTGYLIREVPFTLQERFTPDRAGSYTLSLRPLVRDSLIPGILEVGLTITPCGSEPLPSP